MARLIPVILQSTITHFLSIMSKILKLLSLSAGASLVLISFAGAGEAQWYSWRGPNQNGTSDETYKDWSFDEKPVWVYDKIQGRGTPTIADGNLYSFGYRGTGADFEETLTCLDAESGELKWEIEINDYISDTTYSRYGIGAPTVDIETGNIYLSTTNGHFICASKEGKILWQHSMIERFGRLTFPNGRTGSILVDGDLAVIHCVTSFWGAEGPARDRFYAFDKRTGEPVWSSTPGTQPQDSSFSTPVLANVDGRRVFYAGTGCGNIVCVNMNSGEPIWRWHVCQGGVNGSPVVYKDTLICIHGAENLDTSDVGRMFAMKLPTDLDNVGGVLDVEQGGGPNLPNSVEVWRNDLDTFTSSPTLVGDRVYQLNALGELACVNAETGEVLWKEKLGSDNIHSTPLAVDGKLIVPLNDGSVYIIEPSDKGAKILHSLKLKGVCLGQPTVWNGHLYVHATGGLYCWKFGASSMETPDWPVAEALKAGEAKSLAVIPSDVLLQPGKSQRLRLFSRDANGIKVADVASADFKKFIPPTAKVKAEMDGEYKDGALTAGPDAKVSAGAFMGVAGAIKGVVRGRVLPSVPYAEDFESVVPDEDHPTDGVKFAYPPLPWIGARFKWEIRDLDGNKVMAKTLDRILFQRAMTFIGDPELSDYIFQADVMTDGNRRTKSDVGLINQRYAIVLKGNANQIEITSNHERIKVAEPFTVNANTWYTLKTQVDVAADGSGIVRGKAWEKGLPEPDAWNIEFKHNRANTEGAPGIFGFSPQSFKRVYVDNISISAKTNK